MNTCPNCGMVKGLHASILPGCKCPWTPQEIDCYGDGNVYRGVRSKDSFNPDWNTEAVLVEEMQRMAKRIEDLEAKRESAYQRGYLDGIGRECPHCKDYKAMYIKVRDELAAEQQVTQQQTARIVDLQTHIENLEGED